MNFQNTQTSAHLNNTSYRLIVLKLVHVVSEVEECFFCFWLRLQANGIPNCLLNSIKLAKTFNDDVDNTSDHLPIQLKLSYTVSDSVSTCDEDSKDSRSKLEIHWSKFPSETMNRMYKSPLLFDLEKN